jgi:hypothetical protein
VALAPPPFSKVLLHFEISIPFQLGHNVRFVKEKLEMLPNTLSATTSLVIQHKERQKRES